MPGLGQHTQMELCLFVCLHCHPPGSRPDFVVVILGCSMNARILQGGIFSDKLVCASTSVRAAAAAPVFFSHKGTKFSSTFFIVFQAYSCTLWCHPSIGTQKYMLSLETPLQFAQQPWVYSQLMVTLCRSYPVIAVFICSRKFSPTPYVHAGTKIHDSGLSLRNRYGV